MKTVTIWVTLAAIAVALAIGGVGGWVVKGWKDGAGQTVAANASAMQAKADAQSATDTYNTMLADLRTWANDLQTKNSNNESAMQALTTSIGKQTNAIQSLKNQYASLVVGACTYNADGDELLRQSYEAARPVPAGPAQAR